MLRFLIPIVVGVSMLGLTGSVDAKEAEKDAKGKSPTTQPSVVPDLSAYDEATLRRIAEQLYQRIATLEARIKEFGIIQLSDQASGLKKRHR